MYPVTSSNLLAIGYDPSNETLRIRFKNNTIYDFYNVPLKLYEGLMNANSKGKYFQAYIKDKYPYNKVQL